MANRNSHDDTHPHADELADAGYHLHGLAALSADGRRRIHGAQGKHPRQRPAPADPRLGQPHPRRRPPPARLRAARHRAKGRKFQRYGPRRPRPRPRPQPAPPPPHRRPARPHRQRPSRPSPRHEPVRQWTGKFAGPRGTKRTGRMMCRPNPKPPPCSSRERSSAQLARRLVSSTAHHESSRAVRAGHMSLAAGLGAFQHDPMRGPDIIQPPAPTQNPSRGVCLECRRITDGGLLHENRCLDCRTKDRERGAQRAAAEGSEDEWTDGTDGRRFGMRDVRRYNRPGDREIPRSDCLPGLHCTDDRRGPSRRPTRTIACRRMAQGDGRR